MKRTWIVLPLVAAVLGVTGCAVFVKKDPTPVDHLEAMTTEGGDLVVTWSNPISFDEIDVTIERPRQDGEPVTVDLGRFKGFNRAAGKARLVVIEPDPGTYRIKVVSRANANGESRTVRTNCIVPPPPSGGFITENDIQSRLQGAGWSRQQAAGKQTLDVLFTIHPDALEALGRIGPHARELFRQITAGALRNVFDTAFEVDSRNIDGDTGGLGVVKRIEDYASAVEASGKDPKWPLHPDAIVLVDVRLTSDAFPGQLLIRLYDLRLTAVVEGGVVLRERLYNVRPLVYERFTNLRKIRNQDDRSEIAKVFREAWLDCASRMVCHPRFAEYATLAMKYQHVRQSGDVPEQDRNRIQNLILARLTGDLKPYDPTKEDKVEVYEKRTETIMTELLFGPGVPGPMDLQPNSRFPAPPAEAKPTTPAKTDRSSVKSTDKKEADKKKADEKKP